VVASVVAGGGQKRDHDGSDGRIWTALSFPMRYMHDYVAAPHEEAGGVESDLKQLCIIYQSSLLNLSPDECNVMNTLAGHTDWRRTLISFSPRRRVCFWKQFTDLLIPTPSHHS
jgi:hypothetical protein